MKKLIILSAAVLCMNFASSAQDGYSKIFTGNYSNTLYYEVLPAYKRAIKQENLNNAKLISDVIAGYPVNWVHKYESVEILATCNGKTMKATSKNEVLSAEQRSILATVDLASDITINVKYVHYDHVTKEVEYNTMHVSFTVVPETEAEYIGGYGQMIDYFKGNSLANIPETFARKSQTIIKFTVNESGDIINAKIAAASAFPKTDQLLLELVKKMPKWKPAKNEKGQPVKQDFKFALGSGGGC